ncbi:Divinyl chlorophyllide a 8-vinyl-reductase, chloroplastic [Seminavis robusta]|uniref:Divinyl chlorophyllide a 8-vinyl-reductase, chloroplastic n=1 Tax=Seminavis robusta TaxID=568900 RepID=A0A9N8D6Y2_9STRA|nr:Divinyl chlorophyllide a 8-vinyl-reductase, chloroplastic [Seminavis robusta]|eukprot:Sro23_g015560.1 Divinyl chlorophyllide a 8-vinyl-reductase, chloroplastic (346) ;mRNA; r:12744-14221
MRAATAKTNVIAGASGYIGQSVVKESVKQGFHTVALVRDIEKIRTTQYEEVFRGATVLQCDVTNPLEVNQTLQEIAATAPSKSLEAVISCLASRTGIEKDAYAIDYQATLNCLQGGTTAGARHFVLLSAFCLRNPKLKFQQAKLKFEDKLTSQKDLTWSIVRPTAYFKSVSSQIEVVAYDEAPYVMFGDGEVTKCNPIAESDLARYMIECISDKTRQNRILNVGGPDDPITMKMQGQMIFDLVGRQAEYVTAPIWLFDVLINSLQFLADVFQSESLADAAETGRIGNYYAVEDMLTTEPAEQYGTITLGEHYSRLVAQGRPDYDPYADDALITRKQVANLMKVFL